MKRAMSVLSVCMAAGIMAAGVATAQQDKKPATPPTATPSTPAKPSTPPAPATPAKPDMKLPGGMTPEAMQKAMEDAAKPTEMHKHLAKAEGNWKGESSMWMAPDAPAVKSECTMTCKTIMNGLFTQVTMSGEIPEMGKMEGMGIYGYDTVAKKFQSSWVMNCGSGMMIGTGEMASDGSTINWTYTYTCAIQKKACTMREVEKIIDANTRTITSYGPDPVTGKEFKMMEVTFTRQK